MKERYRPFLSTEINVLNINPEQARIYFENLPPHTYNGEPFLYGLPIQISYNLAREIYNAAYRVLNLVENAIKKIGLTNYLSSSAPSLFGERLNFGLINRQLENRLRGGERMPIVYDVILCDEGGKAVPRVIEIQSGIAYINWHANLLEVLAQVLGPRKDEYLFYMGEENPQLAIKKIKEKFPPPIIVVDANPFGGSRLDEIAMAQMLSSEGGVNYPVPLHLIRRDENGYYFNPFTTDPLSLGRISMEELLKLPTDPSTQIRIKSVVARLTQSDLGKMEKFLPKDLPFNEYKNLLLLFFSDPSIFWVWHPAWQYIVNKPTLPLLRKKLAGSPFQSHFVPIFEAGQIPSPGRYRKKPIDGVSGYGQEIIEISPENVHPVPEGYVYQRELNPFPFPVRCQNFSDDFLALLSPDIIRNHSSLLRQGFFPASVEIRLMSPVGAEMSACYFMARVAPRYPNRNWREGEMLTQTNYGAIHAAVDSLFGGTDNFQYPNPFGWCPIIVIK